MILPIYWFCHAVVRVFAWVWLRRRRVGAHHVPRTGRVLLVANHSSFLDPPLVGTAVDRPVHFLARATLRDVPMWGTLMSWVGTMFVDQEGSARRGLQLAIDQLERDEAVCLFPEGSRSPDGRVGALARGMELVLRRTGAPVVPIGIRGAFESMGRGKNWPRPVRVELHFGAPIPAEAVLAAGGLDELRRRICELAGRPEDADRIPDHGDAAGAPTARSAAASAAAPASPSSSPASSPSPGGASGSAPKAGPERADSGSPSAERAADARR